MKKINLLLAIVIAAILTACSGSSLESKAKERYEKLFASLYESMLSSYKLSDEEVAFAGDSVCVMHYTADVVYLSGEKEKCNMEYIINRLNNGKMRECTF